MGNQFSCEDVLRGRKDAKDMCREYFTGRNRVEVPHRKFAVNRLGYISDEWAIMIASKCW